MKEKRLLDKKAIITGAGKGIGRGIALAYCYEGAKISICDIDKKSLLETVDIINDKGFDCFYEVIDLKNENEIISYVKDSAHHLGGIDILVNNAAVMPTTTIEKLDVRDIDDILYVNLRAPILLTREAFPYIRDSGQGSIIHMASVTGHNGFPDVPVYGATKGGLISLARGHAIELAKYRIRVNSVSPGTIDSPMLHQFLIENSKNPDLAFKKFEKIHPRGKLGSVDEIASVFVFLASEESANITGTDIRCDGGYCIQGSQPK